MIDYRHRVTGARYESQQGYTWREGSGKLEELAVVRRPPHSCADFCQDENHYFLTQGLNSEEDQGR